MTRATTKLLPGRSTAAVAGVLAAAVALSVAELLGGLLPGGRSLFLAVGGMVIELTPGPVVEFAIATFGKANRLVLLVSMAATAAVAGGFIGWWAARRWWAGPLGLGAFAALAVAAGVADPLVPTVTALAGPIAGAASGTTALWLLRAPRTSAIQASASTGASGVYSRRVLLRWAVTLGAAALSASVGRFLQQRAAGESVRRAAALPTAARPLPPPATEASLDVAGLSPLITPNDRFYRIDTALTVPRIDPAAHIVRITGMVDRPYEIGYADLLGLADTEVDVTLACVSNELGGGLVGNARWLGVPLVDVLERAGVQDQATQVVGRALDGWTAGFPTEVALDGRPAVIAVAMNGEPLPPEHGFPVRLVIAGLYGYVSDTKWLSEIELTTFEAYDAYWTQRGWSKLGPIKTQSRIDVPRPGARIEAGTVAIAGVAWAGERGITAVEVTIDNAWQPAELAAELAASSWRQWALRRDAGPGAHVLRVRATDGEGQIQVAENTPPAPDGATGYHTIQVTVI